MVLRTSGSGSNAGSKFWGCTQYPPCKGTLDYPTQSTHTVPRTVFAAPKEDQLQVQFYQACGLPESWVKALHHGGVDRVLIRGAAQWRLDCPLPKSSALTRNQQIVISVAQSLLTRGTTPLCLPTLEECVDIGAHDVSTSALESALMELLGKPSSPFVPSHFESEEERLFHRLIRQWQAARSWWSVLPQVYHTSFSAESNNERVDFLLVSARGDALVIEIDGDQHSQQRSKDQNRDQFLANLGIQTVRVPASEVRSGHGPQLTRLQELLAKIPALTGDHNRSPLTSSLRLFKFLHQVQLASLEALRTGWLSWHEPWVIRCDIPSALGSRQEVCAHAQEAIKGLVELLDRLSKLYEADYSVASTAVLIGDDLDPSIHLVIQDGQENVKAQDPIVPAFYISDVIFPGEIAAPTQSSYPATVAEPSKDVVRWFLNYVFRKDDFWEGQWETIKRALQGKDSVVLLPTGSGKSIAFQLAALILPGPCIAVDPIIALIDDQIDNLRSVGIDRSIGITGQIVSRNEREQVLDAFASGNYLFCYVAPERFQTEPFRERLRALTAASPVSVIAVDEAHCVLYGVMTSALHI